MFGNPFLDPVGGYGFRPQLRPAPKSFGWTIVDPVDQGEPRSEHLVPPHTKFIYDTCSIQTGNHRPVAGHYRRLMSPLHLPDPELPLGDDPADYKPLTVGLVWLEAFKDHPAALRELVISGPIALLALAQFHRRLAFHTEIQQGEAAVVEILECSTFKNGYGSFGRPEVGLIGFVPRDADLFGPAVTPPPPPIISGPAPTQRLPSPDDRPEPAQPDPLAKFKLAAGSSSERRTPF
jgi:hypothetical protein